MLLFRNQPAVTSRLRNIFFILYLYGIFVNEMNSQVPYQDDATADSKCLSAFIFVIDKPPAEARKSVVLAAACATRFTSAWRGLVAHLKCFIPESPITAQHVIFLSSVIFLCFRHTDGCFYKTGIGIFFQLIHIKRYGKC